MKGPFLFIIAFSLLSFRGNTQQLYVPNSDTTWTKDQEPFRIAGNLYYVGSYELCSYLITTPKGDILINTGIPGSDSMIRRHMEALGLRYADIRILLTNQAHFDHVGGMAAIKKATHAQLMVDEKDVPSMLDGGNSDYYMGGHGPTFEPVKVDRVLHDKDVVRLGGMELLVLHHPGHTKGSCSYLFTVKDSARSYRVLIANIPSILSDKEFPSIPAYPEVGKDYGYTLDTMPKLQFDLWFAAHGQQFDLHVKHKPGDGYHPEAFVDRAGYDELMQKLKAEYDKNMSGQ